MTLTSCRGRSLLAALAMTAGLAVPQAQARDGLTVYGDIFQIAIPVIAAATSVAKSDTDGLVQLGATSLAAMGTTEALKYTINSKRPDGHGRQSFPSGHTTAAFMGASYLHYRYGWEYGLPAYAAAALVGYSRVHAREHHWIDVVGGALVGNVAAYFLTDPKDDTVTIMPFTDLRKPSFGIMARIKF